MGIKYKSLTGELKNLIEKNIRNGIERMPTEKELCSRYKVSRQTVRQALSLLEDEKLIIKKQGSGSFITGRSPDPRRNRIPVLLCESQSYLYPGLIKDIQNELERNGLTGEIFTTGNRVDKEYAILKKLTDFPPRGLIVEGCKSGLPNPNLSLYQKLIQTGTVIIFLHNYYPQLSACTRIKDDNIGGSSLLVAHLAAQGYTSIGALFKSDDLQGIERYQGYMETLRSMHLPFSDDFTGWFDSQDQEALINRHDTSFIRFFIQKILNSCSAIICYNDLIAYSLIRELQKMGCRLPDDLAVASFDNTYLSSYETVPFTTLAHRPHEMGTLAVRALMQRIKGLPAHSLEVPWTLNIKSTTQKKH